MSLSRCTETAEIPLPDLPSDSEYWTKVSYSVGYNYTSRYLQGYGKSLQLKLGLALYSTLHGGHLHGKAIT